MTEVQMQPDQGRRSLFLQYLYDYKLNSIRADLVDRQKNGAAMWQAFLTSDVDATLRSGSYLMQSASIVDKDKTARLLFDEAEFFKLVTSGQLTVTDHDLKMKVLWMGSRTLDFVMRIEVLSGKHVGRTFYTQAGCLFPGIFNSIDERHFMLTANT